MAFAFLFPGQGSQSLKMLDSFAENSIVRATFAEANEILQQDFWQMLQEKNEININATINTQPLMLLADIAIWRAWLAQNGAQPTYLAGHSLGEYSALVASGALAFADALRLVRLRGELMQSAVPVGQGAMAAILGLDDDVVRESCAKSQQNSVVEAVNFNAHGQVVIAGETLAVERAIEECKAQGAKRALLLPVSVPSHCALMKGAAAELGEALELVDLSQPALPVIHNADVQSYTDSVQIKSALVRQLYSPVRWTETIEYIVQQKVYLCAECGPGKVLSGLCKRIDSSLRCLNLNSTEGLLAALGEFKLV